MRVLLAPDKFKGCLTAAQVARAMAAGVRRASPSAEIDECPMADGGEGTVEALVRATGGRFITRRVTGPLPEMKVDATFGMLGDGKTAVVEMSAASGLHLLRPDQYDPMATTTFGTGELLLAAIEQGAKKIILGIGGSATCDVGIGCAQACGLPVVLRDGDHARLSEPLCGSDLDKVVLVKRGRGEPTQHIEILVACDVQNPLYGPDGSAHVFGPQKGATPRQAGQLDSMLRELAERLDATEIANIPGAGAAGGLGFGMMHFFHAKLRSGFEIVAEAVGLRDRIAKANLCLTGEGKFDAQSRQGKTPIGVARLCKELDVPCIVIAGIIEMSPARAASEGVMRALAICAGDVTLDQSLSNAAALIEQSTAGIISDFCGR